MWVPDSNGRQLMVKAIDGRGRAKKGDNMGNRCWRPGGVGWPGAVKRGGSTTESGHAG
jgi:hypothetical protein